MTVASLGAPPNLIFVYCDNLGYGDIACFGHPAHRTPRLDRMAAEGMKLTHFYSTSGVCTPSRASLMTGCYPRRVGLDFPDPDGAVLRPISPNGLNPQEITIAEVLKGAGYATMIIGKWHLGDQPEFLPTRQGFDSYFGIPYSDNAHKKKGREHWPELPLMRDETVIEQPVDPDYLDQLQCVRSGEWKLRLPLERRFATLNRTGPAPVALALFDVVADPGETTDRAAEHPDIVKKLTALAERAREDLGDWDRPGKKTRPVGKIEGKPAPQLIGRD